MLDRVNSPRVQALLDRAEECDRKAELAQGVDVRGRFMDFAWQWRNLARQVQELEWEARSMITGHRTAR